MTNLHKRVLWRSASMSANGWKTAASALLEANEIDGDSLPGLTDEHLKELGLVPEPLGNAAERLADVVRERLG